MSTRRFRQPLRSQLGLGLALLLGMLMAACPSPKMPKGPPPEYEDPPPPSWMTDAGSTAEAAPAVD